MLKTDFRELSWEHCRLWIVVCDCTLTRMSCFKDIDRRCSGGRFIVNNAVTRRWNHWSGRIRRLAAKRHMIYGNWCYGRLNGRRKVRGYRCQCVDFDGHNDRFLWLYLCIRFRTTCVQIDLMVWIFDSRIHFIWNLMNSEFSFNLSLNQYLRLRLVGSHQNHLIQLHNVSQSFLSFAPVHFVF